MFCQLPLAFARLGQCAVPDFLTTEEDTFETRKAFSHLTFHFANFFLHGVHAAYQIEEIRYLNANPGYSHHNDSGDYGYD